jgi:competence protein ComEA
VVQILRNERSFPLVTTLLLLTLSACRSATLVITAAPLPTFTPPVRTASPGPILVDVDGAVSQAGRYTLPPGSLVDDALRAAGGPTADADLERINLARELNGNDVVHVPRLGEVIPTPTPYGLSVDGKIDINLADAALLETLPRIGPTIAQRITEYREMNGPFEATEDIQEVQGIGPATFEGIKDLITSEGLR